VKVYINGKEINTGETFIGLFMGDHSKTGIGTLFNTGTVVSVGCNLYGSDLPPKYIPSFTWGGNGHYQEYQLDRFIQTAQRVMARRQVKMGDAYRQMLEIIFKQTAKERTRWNHQNETSH
jgi:hypothetical protein